MNTSPWLKSSWGPRGVELWGIHPCFSKTRITSVWSRLFFPSCRQAGKGRSSHQFLIHCSPQCAEWAQRLWYCLVYSALGTRRKQHCKSCAHFHIRVPAEQQGWVCKARGSEIRLWEDVHKPSSWPAGLYMWPLLSTWAARVGIANPGVGGGRGLESRPRKLSPHWFMACRL